MKKKQIISGIVAAAIIAGAGAGVFQAVRATTTSQTVTVFQAENANSYYGGGSTVSMSGSVVSDASQNVILSGTESVSEVKVKEGDKVKEGQVLLVYDTTATGLNLEREKLNRESIQLNIEVAEKNINTLNKLRPVSDSIIPDEPGWNDGPGDDEDQEVQELIDRLNTLDEEKLAKVLAGVENRQALVDALKQMKDRKAAAVIAVLASSAADSNDAEHDHSTKLLQSIFRNSMIGTSEKNIGAEDLGNIAALLSEKDLANVLKFMSKMYRTGSLSDDEVKRQAEILGTIWKAVPEADEEAGEKEVSGDSSASSGYGENEDQDSGGGYEVDVRTGREKMTDALLSMESTDIAAVISIMNSYPDVSVRRDAVLTVLGDLETAKLESVLAALGGAHMPDLLGAAGTEGFTRVLSRLGTGKQASLINSISLENSVFENFAASLVSSEKGKTYLSGLVNGLSPERKTIVKRLLDPEASGTSGDDGTRENVDVSGGSGNSDESEDTSNNSSSGSTESAGGAEDQANPSSAGTGSTGGADDQKESSGSEDDVSADSAAASSAALSSYRTISVAAPLGLASGSGSSYDSTEGADTDTSGSDAGDTSGSGSQLIASNAQMTKSEIADEKKNQEDSLKSLKLDLAESDLKIKAAEKALDEGVVKAKMNGVVKKVSDPKNPPTDGSAFLTVTSTEGLYVRGGLPELQKDNLKEGDTVSVTSYDSGGFFEAVVKDISIYPDETGQFSYGEDTTYYPFTAYIDDPNAQLTNGEYVDISKDDTGQEQGTDTDSSGSGLWLPGMFVREDDGGKYVYMRGEDGRLKKQYVKVGRLQDSTYQILSGVSGEDWITFPYGKNVKEGARTKEGTIDEIYS